MRTGRILTLVFFLTSLAVGQGEKVGKQLDAKEKQLEDLYADYWRAEYKIALGDEHLSSAPIQDRIRSVVSDDKFLADLKAAHSHDPLLRRRRDLFLEEATFTKDIQRPEGYRPGRKHHA